MGLRLLDAEAYRAAPILQAKPVALPSSIDISVDAPAPGNQGWQGSCVGWAVAYTVKTYHERIERGWRLTDKRHVMSPAYVYNQIKVPGGGAYYPDAFGLLASQGVSSWAAMPYNQLDDRTQPSASARAEATNYRIASWGTVLSTTYTVFLQEVKRHLAAGDPELIAIPVYPDFQDLSESNPVYDSDSGKLRGYHAVVIVGYDDIRSAFKVVNSWGTGWGIGGYGWIDYDASDDLIVSAYVTEDMTDDEPKPLPPEPSDWIIGELSMLGCMLNSAQ
ncbi:MAG: C1 family peptidase [Spirochaetaceae bacterium]|nr:C1 family peptidase [Spirochaetaceae bacterium]